MKPPACASAFSAPTSLAAVVDGPTTIVGIPEASTSAIVETASIWARGASADSIAAPAQVGAWSVTSIRYFGSSVGNARRCAAPAAIARAVAEPLPVRFVAPMATATASALNGVTGTSTPVVTVPGPQAGPASGNA